MKFYTLRKAAIIFLLFSNCQSWGLTFPKGCLTDNLDKICTLLGRVSPDANVIFSTGETLPGCFLLTKHPNSVKLINDFKYFSSQLSLLLKQKYPSDQMVTDYLAHPEKIDIKRFSNVKDFQYFYSSYISFRKLVNDSYPKKYATKINALQNEELISAKQQIKSLLAQVKETDSFFSSTKLKFDSQPSEQNCYPDPNAFLNPSADSHSILLTTAISQYPSASRKTVITHEIAHTFDPCLYDYPTKKNSPHPFGKAIECLKENLKFSPGRNICEANHLREAFCDLVSATALAEDLEKSSLKSSDNRKGTVEISSANIDKDKNLILPKGFEHLFYILDRHCADKDFEESKSHPSSERRLLELYLRHPKIAKFYGCEASQPYCDLFQGLSSAGKETSKSSTSTSKRSQ